MKGNSIFLTFIVAALVLMVALQLYMPQPYVWSETHAADAKPSPRRCASFVNMHMRNFLSKNLLLRRPRNINFWSLDVSL